MKKIILLFFFLLYSVPQFSQILESKIESIISQMSTEEKINQLINNTFFTTDDNIRLGVPGFKMSDGPHGVRFGGATSFPTGISMAASWDIDLVERVGKAMGEEFWAHGKHQQLGPCIDLCRDPRNGRSPESAGEDPYLAGKLATAVIKGIQQTPVIATAKHFNLVNKQQYRGNSNVTISKRWLMEHYGHDFRMAVQEGGVLSVMNAYNLINNIHCSENKELLSSILREQWGFPFYVVSDWGAIHNSKKAIEAGTDICMGSDHYKNDLPNLLTSNNITEATLDGAVRNVLRTKLIAGMLYNYPRAPSGLINSLEHQQIALEAAQKVLVLLKNQDKILPINSNDISKIALIGPSANKAQLDGFGSSWVDAIYTVSPREGMENIIGEQKVDYAYGCNINSSDTSGFGAARLAASSADFVVFVGGLDDTQEGEGYGDRPEYDRAGGSIQLPGKQQDLINELAKVNENIIVVIKSGGICGLDKCIDNIKGLVYAFYPGQEGGNAIAGTLFGGYNPGGKLPVTIPKTDAQLPPWNDNFNDDFGCGYRWYDEMNIEPQFVFGYGLSYSEFEYSNLQISSNGFNDGKPITVSVDITNKSELAGEEIAQLYIKDEVSSIWMPEKQLKGFNRVSIDPGETKNVSFELVTEDFYFWNEQTDSYSVEPGVFSVMVGGSSDKLPLQSTIEISPENLKADITISKIITIPRYPVEGDSVYFLAMVRNIGGEALNPGDKLDINFEIDNQIVATANYNELMIPAGGMIMVEANSGFWLAENPGEQEVKAIFDPNEGLIENIENNNEQTQSILISDQSTVNLLENIALFKPVTSTSSENNSLGPENAVDGNSTTRWSSMFYDPQEFTVDLKDVYDIELIRIQWEAAFSKKFVISMSEDSIDWNDVIIENNGFGSIAEYGIEQIARYIKFAGLERATQWGHSFYEFEVYGKLYELPDTNLLPKEILDRIFIFPNPVRDKLHFSQINPEIILNIKAYDIQGHLAFQKYINTEEGIDIRNFNTGIYFIQIGLEDSVRTIKIAVQK